MIKEKKVSTSQKRCLRGFKILKPILELGAEKNSDFWGQVVEGAKLYCSQLLFATFSLEFSLLPQKTVDFGGLGTTLDSMKGYHATYY